MVGNSNVGKTSLIQCWNHIGGHLDGRRSMTTLQPEVVMKKMTVKNGTQIKCQVWDTSGESEKYNSLTVSSFRKAVGALVVFDLCDQTSFKNISRWIN